MSTIILPIGISGSGKSTWLKERLKNEYDIVVSSDELRLKLTGRVSDESKIKEVFELAELMIDDAVKQNKSVYYDATNLRSKHRRRFVNKYINNPNVRIEYYILPADIKASYERIQKDLDNGVNRYDVSRKGLEKQYQMYNYVVNSNFEGENVHKIVYVNKD